MIPPELIEAVAREACKQMGLDADERGCGAILGETAALCIKRTKVQHE